ncbi:hypothetical protein Tco_0862071 [Tanacetum coccineum]
MTTEVLEVSSLPQQGVYPIQVCTASKYYRGYSSRKPKSIAAESARSMLHGNLKSLYLLTQPTIVSSFWVAAC